MELESSPAQDVSDQSIAAAFREADGKWFQSQHELRTWVEARARELQQAQPRNEWKDAVIDELITAHVYQKEHETNPRKAIQDAITWNCQVALDPAVSSDARALVERGLQQAQVVDWRKFPYSIAWCDGLRSVLIECDEYGAAEQIDAIKRYIDTPQSSAPVVGEAMVAKAYRVCEDFIEEHGDGYINDLDDGQWNEMLRAALESALTGRG